jgi:hypothetical protein
MAVTSIRFNQEDEKIINFLRKTLNSDTSSVVKRALYDLYEEIREREIIEEFEVRESESEVHFSTLDESPGAKN